MVNVLKLSCNKTRKKMRQRLEGKSTTKPAYTLECKVNRLAWIEGRFDSDGRYWYGSPPGERFESSPNHKKLVITEMCAGRLKGLLIIKKLIESINISP